MANMDSGFPGGFPYRGERGPPKSLKWHSVSNWFQTLFNSFEEKEHRLTGSPFSIQRLSNMYVYIYIRIADSFSWHARGGWPRLRDVWSVRDPIWMTKRRLSMATLTQLTSDLLVFGVGRVVSSFQGYPLAPYCPRCSEYMIPRLPCLARSTDKAGRPFLPG